MSQKQLAAVLYRLFAGSLHLVCVLCLLPVDAYILVNAGLHLSHCDCLQFG